MYKYDPRQSNPPTVDDMLGEYKIAITYLSIKEFIDLYPEVTLQQLSELRDRFDRWFDETFTKQPPQPH